MGTWNNFKCLEQRPLAVTSSSGGVAFTNANSAAAPDIMIVNYGTKGCQVKFGTTTATAVATASAGGTDQVYIAGGVVMTIGKGGANYVAAICDGSDSTNLALHIGYGS